MANLLEIIIKAEDQTNKQLEGVVKSIQQMSSQLYDLAKAITVVGPALIGTWAEASKEVAKLADRTGFSTETLSELGHDDAE